MEALATRLESQRIRIKAWQADAAAQAEKLRRVPATAAQQTQRQVEIAKDRERMERVFFEDWRAMMRQTRRHNWRSIAMAGITAEQRAAMLIPQPAFELAVLVKSLRWRHTIWTCLVRVRELEGRLLVPPSLVRRLTGQLEPPPALLLARRAP